MWTDAILAYLHFAAILSLVWFLAKEWTLLRAGAPRIDTERLASADAGFGVTAMLVLVTGGLRAVYGAKGWPFYAHNPACHVKVTLFVIVGLVSIAPTLAFIRWRNFRVQTRTRGWAAKIQSGSFPLQGQQLTVIGMMMPALFLWNDRRRPEYFRRFRAGRCWINPGLT